MKASVVQAYAKLHSKQKAQRITVNQFRNGVFSITKNNANELEYGIARVYIV